ncbi:hypothetical protein GUJ93_ZPchr0056g33619 [Zizania palustris]|uniref:SCP domain-containing protein n=1 Tax=Zizania palustris TaxID=103762 RepID=A0A8J5RDA3_ZIZPA|nr:hypothetical protein GUJ93_ZPchr0056g33619 [Zizania palustris]
MWVSEKEYYNYDNNTCSAGQYGCLHYTQVVWRDTTTIGCGGVTYTNTSNIFIIYSYSPPGNWNNQKPY